jgi:hypothetical protein
MNDTPETDAIHYEEVDCLENRYALLVNCCREIERERNLALLALHQCYAATGEDAGYIDDFRALVDREKHTVNAVREMRKELDRLTAEYRDSKD